MKVTSPGARRGSFACGHRIVGVSHLRSTLLQTTARCRWLPWRDPEVIQWIVPRAKSAIGATQSELLVH